MTWIRFPPELETIKTFLDCTTALTGISMTVTMTVTTTVAVLIQSRNIFIVSGSGETVLPVKNKLPLDTFLNSSKSV